MDEHIKKDILAVLDKTIMAARQENILVLKDLSNQTIHNATIHQDEYSISIAVFLYVLSKVNERQDYYGRLKGWKSFYEDCYKFLEEAKKRLLSDDYAGFENILRRALKNFEKSDTELKKQIQEVLLKAKINKASRLYEHGVSMGRTADLLGISRFELMDYIGKTFIADSRENLSMDPIKRLKYTRSLFK